MKKKETATVLMEGLENCYNYMRPHMGIEDETPAERANLRLGLGRNRWQSIIASYVRKEVNYMFACRCGKSFVTRDDIRRHIKKCDQIPTAGYTCSGCLERTEILLPYGEKMVCPSCAILYEKPKIIFGVPLVNHMGEEYESIFRNKAKTLLRSLNAEKLSDLGITLALITYTQSYALLTYRHSPKGELIYLFNRIPQLAKREKETFTNAVTHEIFHGYVSKMKLGVSDVLEGPFSFMEEMIASLAEDIQLTKLAVNLGVKLLIKDEIKRDHAYYTAMPVPSSDKWEGVSDEMKFGSMTSLTFVYATELWFSEIMDSHSRKKVRKTLRLVQRHFDQYGYLDLGELIGGLYRGEMSETESDKTAMYKKLLNCCDRWVNGRGLNLY